MIVQDDLAGLFLDEQFRAPEPPAFLSFSDAEIKLRSALRAIEEEANTYCATIALMNYSSNQDRAYLGKMLKARSIHGRTRTSSSTIWADWQFIAARAGVLAARNLQEALISLNWHIRADPEFTSVDHKALRNAKRAMNQLFPGLRDLRDAVAHPEEYQRDEVDTTGGDRKGTMKDCLTGDGYQATFKGKVLFCPLSSKSAAAVCAIATRALRAFDAYGRRLT